LRVGVAHGSDEPFDHLRGSLKPQVADGPGRLPAPVLDSIGPYVGNVCLPNPPGDGGIYLPQSM
jgi:hypothetical protein